MIKFKKFGTLIAAAAIIFIAKTPAKAASYQVVSGDSLYFIGKTFNTSSQTLMNNNGLSNSSIKPGQVLNVPGTDYTVKSGDSLFFIAKRYGISINSLREANNRWTDTIYLGENLVIPVGSNWTSSKNATAQPAKSTSTVTATSTQNNTAKTAVNCTQSDLDLLSRLITAEAGGESYNAMVSVGAVIINRVKNPQFPNTISAVINDKPGGYYQFTPVLNGMINKPASLDAIKAANDALKGTDPTNGALYFYDTTATNSWLRAKPVAASIGGLVFAY